MSWIGKKPSPAAFVRGAAAVTAILCLALACSSSAKAAPPLVKATSAAEVTATSFQARGIIDTGGLNSTYRFDYISLAAYEANVSVGNAGFAGALHMPVAGEAKLLASLTDQEAAQRVGNLTAETAYRFRLVAKNPSGESIGPIRTVVTQEASPSFSLAENRGWELVSPIDKNGGGVSAPEELFGGGVLQAAAQGNSVTYGSASSFAGASGAPGASQYISVRSTSGWATQNVSLPTEAGSFGPVLDGVPYRFFAPDLATAVALTEPHAFQLLTMSPGPISLTSLASPDLRLAGVSSGLAEPVFATCEALTPDAIEVPGGEGCDPAFPNLYLLAGGGLRLLNLEPGEVTGTPGATLAAQAGAVSSGGGRAFWADSSGALLVRDGNRSLLVDAEGEFQVASADGGVAYYLKASHLFRYSISTESSADLTPAGGVVGVLGASASGSHVYYQDGAGVELWRAGTTTLVAAAADPSSFPPARSTARVTADGTRLAFLSTAPLTGYDSEGATELFHYDASTGALLCASCNPTGARPKGPASVPGVVGNGADLAVYKPRVMDAQGLRLFFDSSDALVAPDSNGERDVYEWRAAGVAGCGKASGCIGLISSGKGADGSTFVDASADAADVFFLAGDSLVVADPGSVDLYDARIGGGFPPAVEPIPCFGDACQPLPPEPDDPTPGTQFHSSEVNPPLQISTPRKKSNRKKHRKHRHKAKGKRKHRGGRR